MVEEQGIVVVDVAGVCGAMRGDGERAAGALGEMVAADGADEDTSCERSTRRHK